MGDDGEAAAGDGAAEDIPIGAALERVVQALGCSLVARSDGADHGGGMGTRLKIDPAATDEAAAQLRAVSAALSDPKVTKDCPSHAATVRRRLRCAYFGALPDALADTHRCGHAAVLLWPSAPRKAFGPCGHMAAATDASEAGTAMVTAEALC